jgi:hypothetical protein
VVCVGIACADRSGMGVSSVGVILCRCWVVRSAVTEKELAHSSFGCHIAGSDVTTLHRRRHVAETSATSFTADMALAGCLRRVRACCRGGGSLTSVGSGG